MQCTAGGRCRGGIAKGLAGHTALPDRKQRELPAGAQITVPSLWNGAFHIRGLPSSSAKPLWKHSKSHQVDNGDGPSLTI